MVDALVSGASVQKTCRFESCSGHGPRTLTESSIAKHKYTKARVVKLVDTLL